MLMRHSLGNASKCYALAVLQAEDVAEAVMLAVKTKQVGGPPKRPCHVMLPFDTLFNGLTAVLHVANLQCCTPVDITLRPTEPVS